MIGGSLPSPTAAPVKEPTTNEVIDMARTVEIVRFRIKDDRRSDFLRLRPAAVQAVRAAHPQLVGAPVLVEHADGSWTDVWIYETAEGAALANRQAGAIPAFAQMADLLDDVTIQEGTAPEAGHDPIETGAAL